MSIARRENLNRKIIHIGMGKNGSTYLQRWVFPFLCERHGIEYNPREFDDWRKLRLSVPTDHLDNLRKKVLDSDVLISSELLIGWNPRDWEECAEKTLEIFGEDATIVIFIRDPAFYLSAVYLQKVSEGLMQTPSEFFVSSEEYEKLKDFMPKIGLLKFDLDSFCYTRLEQIYRSRFDNVYLLPITALNCQITWCSILGLSKLDYSFPKKTSNRSFSRFAVKLTFLRYNVFRFFGGRPISSTDFEYLLPRMYSSSRQSFKTLSKRQKLVELPVRIRHRFLKPWKWWMQNIIDRMVPYSKYEIDFTELPAKTGMAVNQKFYDDLVMKYYERIRTDGSGNSAL